MDATNNPKRRRIVHPTLDGIKPVSRVASPKDERRVFPVFLHNALFSQATEVPYEKCPFERYINLGGEAWSQEGGSEYLIERPCYQTLIEFLDKRFRDFQVGIQQVSVITGTAGIGKTMFALYAARYYFQRSEFVVLYYQDYVWAFTHTNPLEFEKTKRHPHQDLMLEKGTQPDGQDFWYGITQTTKRTEFEERMTIWGSSGCAIIIRDHGTSKCLELLASRGREVYTVSAGQKSFLSSVDKLGISPYKNERTAELWSGEDYMYAVKLGLFLSNPPSALDLDYVMEGYRRYGGSARSVLQFANILKDAQTAKQDIHNVALPTETIIAMTKMAIAGQQVMRHGELFHRSPVVKSNGAHSYRVQFASPYLGQQLMNVVKYHNSKALRHVVNALSVTRGQQDAYGVLYEEKVNKEISAVSGDSLDKYGTATLLGCHEPSKKRVKGIVAKSQVSLNIARASIVDFPGSSLEDVRLEDKDKLLETYFYPLPSNFPTHDSFVFCPASDFFSVDPADSSSLTEDERRIIENNLESNIVLVGLHMTVSGNDNVYDKPSHTIYGAHLTNGLDGMKESVKKSHPDVNIHPDVVTIFVSPMESCRKTKYMPVATTTAGTELKTGVIPNFSGMAPQYYTIFEVKMIQDLMTPALVD